MKDVGAQLLAEKVLPESDGAQAQLKVYSAPPHAMDRHDKDLTRLSSSLGTAQSSACPHCPAAA